MLTEKKITSSEISNFFSETVDLSTYAGQKGAVRLLQKGLCLGEIFGLRDAYAADGKRGVFAEVCGVGTAYTADRS